MSLINDALKRATAEQPRATLPPGEVPPMQPVHTAPRPSSSPLVAGGIILIGIGAIGIAAALWFKGQAPTPVHAAAPVQTQPTPQPQTIAAVQPPASTAPTQPKQSPAPAPTKVAAATTAHTKTPPATSTAAKTVAPSSNTATQKPIRLQSIFYRIKQPTVILNGKTLGVGDSVDGIKIVSIQRTSVEVVQNGKYRTLTLQD